MDMDGAHGHVCHAEGGHGDGIHIALMIASTQHTECDICFWFWFWFWFWLILKHYGKV